MPEEPAPHYQIAKIYLYVFQELDDADYYIKEAIKLKIPESRYRKEIRLIHRQLLIQFSILFILVISIFILSGLGYTIFNILERNGL